MTSQTQKSILVLGCEMVAPPCIEYLSCNPDNEITRLAKSFPRTRTIALDTTSEVDLENHVAKHDVGNTQVVTTSYVSDAIRALDEDTKKVGITVLNEVGVGPGVGHLYTIKEIDEVHAEGGRVLEFYSYQCANNPLGFKGSARFLKNGKIQEVSSDKLMATAAPYYVMDGYDFVAYPNRDSGNPAFVQALAKLGWLEQDKKDWLKDGMRFSRRQSVHQARKKDVAHFLDEIESQRIVDDLKWMGIISSEKATIVNENLLDTLCARLEKLMSFLPSERDLVMLKHKFVIEWLNRKTETFTSTLKLFGDPDRYSKMALSVGVTCGIATQLLLDGRPAVRRPGALAPYTKDL
ncbi:hypothetical protein GQ44DRAFT_751600 [Phaeosphaeriaceae sp. PMI808]|nr:hypothetical protein GQ44DRAFT_751600 [Phaeosphaeriaceae sp. PMI808]